MSDVDEDAALSCPCCTLRTRRTCLMCDGSGFVDMREVDVDVDGIVLVDFETLPNNITLWPWQEAPSVLVETLRSVSPRFEARPDGWIFFVPTRFVETFLKRWTFRPHPLVSIDIDGVGTVGWLP